MHASLRSGGADLEWLGAKYSLVNRGKDFTAQEHKLLKSIGKVLSTRYQLLFNAEVEARSSEIFGGLPEDHYVSGFLDPYVFAGAAALSKVTDRVSEAIELLRISALSTYEDRRISTGALLFGFQPDACHSLPTQPPGALPYSSELTSIRSFHRICDGLRTVALVDRAGLMVELVDIAEWARPFAQLPLPVPSARRYEGHNRATLCGGHVCLVLTPNGEIKIFADGTQVFSFLDGRWHLTDAVEKYRVWEESVGNKELAHRLFSAALNLAEGRRGGLFVILDDRGRARELLSDSDLLHPHHDSTKSGSKNQLHYLLRSQNVSEISQPRPRNHRPHRWKHRARPERESHRRSAQSSGTAVRSRLRRMKSWRAAARAAAIAASTLWNCPQGKRGRTAIVLPGRALRLELLRQRPGPLSFSKSSVLCDLMDQSADDRRFYATHLSRSTSSIFDVRGDRIGLAGGEFRPLQGS